MIPGGYVLEKYKQVLNTIATFANSLKGKDGKLVAMILRPFHEFDGDWFWWGKSHCSVDAFKTI